MYSQLPPAIEMERETLLQNAFECLLERGHGDIHIADFKEFEQPRPCKISVLNVVVQPDLEAQKPDQIGPTVASVEVSSDLGDESCGRRWQALSRWAKEHNGQYLIFIHPEDQNRAQAIAQLWEVDADHFVSLPRG